MNRPQDLARLLFDANTYGPTSGFGHSAPLPASFSPPQQGGGSLPLAPPMGYPNTSDMTPNTRVAQGFSALPAGYQLAPPQQPVPLPRPNPMAANAAAPGAPISLAPPPQQPLSQFNGASGPQWSDQQWQNFWDRSTPTF